jgi:hypothetical protein
MISGLNWFKHNIPSLMLTIGYLVVLGLAALGVGMVLDIYNASRLIWLGTFAITVHLAWAGTGAIALAMVWILILIWVAALIFATPKQSPMIPTVWAISLMKLWLLGTLYTMLLGFASRPLTRWGLNRIQSFTILLIFAWSALGLGARIHS